MSGSWVPVGPSMRGSARNRVRSKPFASGRPSASPPAGAAGTSLPRLYRSPGTMVRRHRLDVRLGGRSATTAGDASAPSRSRAGRSAWVMLLLVCTRI